MALRFFRNQLIPPVVGRLEQQHEASLVAATRFLAAGGAFSGAWMRQYQAGPYKLELRLEPGPASAKLRGRLHVVGADGRATLESEDGGVIAIATLDPGGWFELPVRSVGGFQLRVIFAGANIIVPDLDIV